MVGLNHFEEKNSLHPIETLCCLKFMIAALEHR